MKILFAIIGLYLGAVLDEWNGSVFGFFIGLLAGTLIQYSKRIKVLEDQIKQLLPGYTPTAPDAAAQQTVTPAAVTTAARSGYPDESTEDTEITLIPPDSTTQTDLVTPESEAPSVTIETATVTPSGWSVAAPRAKTAPPSAPAPAPVNRAIKFIHDFFTTGNVVVKVGAIILLFGISFLLKFATENIVVPLEFRFIAVAIFAIFLLVTGWRLRTRQLQYALILQGTGVGILYITIFVATREDFHILPLGLAFGLMFSLVIFSSLLAVVQNAMSLAIFATIGGFLAPILTSSGAGNHVALFSYYSLLNAGIFGIAWYKSWRPLNWTGFVFTFVISALWGYEYYRPEYFGTTEPFLILFFIFYVTIAILFAYRQPPELKGFVDASIVFGTPLVGFTLQSGLVRDIEFGQAYSALIISSVYIVLARALWNRQVEGMRMLTEAFLALGVIFASLAIPLALDGRWTAAAWAVEGGGMLWIGIRQNRMLPRLFGLLLQFGAGIAFITVMHDPHGDLPVLNSAYLGAIMVSIAGLFTSYHSFKYCDKLHAAERQQHIVLLVWGLLWWFGAGLMEIDEHLTSLLENNVELFFFSFSLYYLYIVARTLNWTPALKPQVLLLPLMALIAFINFIEYYSANPFAQYGFVSWITAFTVQYVLLHRSETVWNPRLIAWWHRGTLWLVLFMITWVCAQAVAGQVPGLRNWSHVLWGFIPAMGVFALIFFRDRIEWPLQRFAEDYLGAGLFPVITCLAIWVFAVLLYEGDPAPLPYVPVINPHELAQLFAMVAIFDWLIRWKRNEIAAISALNPDRLLVILAGIAFLWLNSVVARTVHFYNNVNYSLQPMVHSALFQTSISIVWTLTAFALMGIATHRGSRKLWFTGAVLLGMVVLKLFIVDLADIGTVARIISFLTVGVLMLIIGYFSPLPPRQQQL